MSSQYDVVTVKIGKFYDWLEIDPESDYLVDVVEPFLALNIGRGGTNAKLALQFDDDEGNQYTCKVKDILQEGALKIYYHGDHKQFNQTLFEKQRKPGMIKSLLSVIELVVPTKQERLHQEQQQG